MLARGAEQSLRARAEGRVVVDEHGQLQHGAELLGDRLVVPAEMRSQAHDPVVGAHERGNGEPDADDVGAGRTGSPVLHEA